MTSTLRYPRSFPNEREETFLKLVLCADSEFPARWVLWREQVVFDDIDSTTLRLLPLLHMRLRALGLHDETSARIKGVYRMTWYKNQTLLTDVRGATAALNAVGITPVALKGIALVLAAYRDTGARSMGDIDLLVAPHEAGRAAQALLDSGWQLTYDHRLISQEEFLRRFADPFGQRFIREIELRSPQGIALDLHTALFPFDLIANRPHAMSLEQVASRLQPLALGQGLQCGALCLEDALLHVVAHGSPANETRGFRWVPDAVAIVRAPGLDWEAVLERTERFGLAFDMYTGLSYLQERIGVPVPDNVLERLSAVPVSDEYKQRYFARAKKVRLVGTVHGVPIVLLAWWRHGRTGAFGAHVRGLLEYVCFAWGLERPRSIPLSMFAKIKRHLSRASLGMMSRYRM